MGVEHKAKSPESPDAKELKAAIALTPDQLDAIKNKVALLVQGLTVRTRGHYVKIARLVRQWGKGKGIEPTGNDSENTAYAKALETDYALNGVKLDMKLVRDSFSVLPDWRKAKKMGAQVEHDWFNAPTKEAADAVLGKTIKTGGKGGKMTPAKFVGNFTKSINRYIKSNDPDTLLKLSRIVAKALSTVYGRTRRKPQKTVNGAVVEMNAHKPLEVKTEKIAS